MTLATRACRRATLATRLSRPPNRCESSVNTGARRDPLSAAARSARDAAPPRFKIAEEVEVLVDGNTATLVDLSTVGAQVILATILRPNQRVRMTLSDGRLNVRFNAAVAWAAFEIPPKGGPRYRAGIKFIDADTAAVGTFCAQHKP